MFDAAMKRTGLTSMLILALFVLISLASETRIYEAFSIEIVKMFFLVVTIGFHMTVKIVNRKKETRTESALD